jgi:Reeler domain
MLFSLSVVLTFSLLIWVASALRDGAPICESGTANVRSLHLDRGRNPRTGDIQSNGFDVFLNNTLIQPGTRLFPTKFKAHTNINVTIKSRTGERFRGILLLLHQPGVNVHIGEGLLPTEPFKDAVGCGGTNISGVTHAENSFKTEVTAILHYDDTSDACMLDVNIVTANNEIDGSSYFFSQYYLRAQEEGDDHDDDDKEIKPKRCGLFGLSIFCPFTFCGMLGRFLGLCRQAMVDDE